MKDKGFTLLELVIILVILGILFSLFIGVFINNRGATERRAIINAEKFLANNKIFPSRFSCAGDSNSDGYGTCNILTDKGEKIILECPTGYFDVNWFGASECKEVFQNYNFTFSK